MELFKHRNTALGCGCFLVLLFASFYFNKAARIATLVFAGAAVLLLFALLLRSDSHRILTIAAKAIPALLLCALAMVLSLVSFDKSRVLSLDEGREYTINAVITDCQYFDSYFGIYESRLTLADGEAFDENITLFAYGNQLERGTAITASGTFTHLKDTEENGYNLSRGIVTSFEAKEYSATGKESFPIRDFLENANGFLSSTLDGLGDSSKPLISALILGNKAELDPQIRRDFAKIGLSHILALSGMHITIIVTLLSFVFERFSIRRIWKEIILIFVTLCFVGITGFSESAMRAGLMVTLTILLSFIGNRANTVSALFFSASIICIIDPYSVFSVSLWLSFFAMLGCLASARIARAASLWQRIRSKLLRYIAISFITSAAVLVFTMPIVYLVFGHISVLSPFTNLVFSPVFTLLIYISPVYMATSQIPLIEDALGWIIEKISSLLILGAEWSASFEGTVIPITGYVQIAGAAVAVCFALAFLVCKRQLALRMVGGVACGILILAIGTGIMLYNRNTSVYAGAISNGEGDDAVFIEDKGELTVFQIGSSYSLCGKAMRSLGYYYEIDNLVITDYNKNTYTTLLYISNISYLKNVYLPSPLDEYEEGVYCQAAALASERGIGVHTVRELSHTKSAEIEFSENNRVGYSDVRVIAFSIAYQSTKFTYLGKGANHLYNEFVLNEPALSDVLVIGTAGPKRDSLYYYDTGPYLDLCIFLGDSQKHAHKDFLPQVSGCAITDKTELPRIKFPD